MRICNIMRGKIDKNEMGKPYSYAYLRDLIAFSISQSNETQADICIKINKISRSLTQSIYFK